MKLGEGAFVRQYTIFLSSGDDAQEAGLRDRVENLVIGAMNPPLQEANVGISFYVDRWERTTPQRTEEGESTNDQFVRRAKSSDLTLTLLLAELGDGTRAELEGVLEENAPLSALWFVERDEDPSNEVAGFLRSNEERLLYSKTGRPESDESWEGIVKVLVSALVEAMQPKAREYVEQRD